MLIHLFCKCLLALRKTHAFVPCLSPGHKQTPYMRNLTSHRSWGWKVRDQGTGTQWKNSCCTIPLCKAEGQERVRENKGSTGTTVEGFNFKLTAASNRKQCAQKHTEILGCSLLRSGSDMPRCMQKHPDSHDLDQKTPCPHVHRSTQMWPGAGKVSLYQRNWLGELCSVLEWAVLHILWRILYLYIWPCCVGSAPWPPPTPPSFPSDHLQQLSLPCLASWKLGE